MADDNQRPPYDQPQYDQSQSNFQQPPPLQPPPYYYQQQYYQPYQYGPPMENRPVGFIEAYKAYWKNFANFNDRTSRAGYWWVFLMNTIIGIVFMSIMLVATGGLISYGLGDPISINDYGPSGIATSYLSGFLAFNIIYSIWGLANLVPGLAICVRRLHDIGKSWVYILFALIPFVGAIILIIFLATAQKHPPENQFATLRQV